MSDTPNTDFEQYIRQGEPDRSRRAGDWSVAIGLQAVDGLKTSEYLIKTALRHIEGEISIDEAQSLIRSYYKNRDSRTETDSEIEEADKAASNITKILNSDTLDFSLNGLKSLHRRIFDGVFAHAGSFRDYDITKNEWVLERDTVFYLNFEDISPSISFAIGKERHFSYNGLSTDQMVSHIATFVSELWQIHPFCEGNTRTTAVFAILYLRSIGFNVNNDLFANHSWYFRNALVRANYKNAKKGIDYSPVYLERFFRNLLFGDQWDLRNRYLHINPTDEWKIQPNLAHPTTSEQLPDNYPSITRQPPVKFDSDNLYINKLVEAIGNSELSLKEMLAKLGLKDREHFTTAYLNPAINEKIVCQLFPKSPHHPRQKYMLSVKGLALYNALTADGNK